MVMVFICYVRSIVWCLSDISYRLIRLKIGCGFVGDRLVEFFSYIFKVVLWLWLFLDYFEFFEKKSFI